MPWEPIDAEKAIPWVEARTGLSLADSQKTAIKVALRSKVMVITGGPGVGKTTLVNSILRILAAKKARLLLCAPTGRAAKRMTEMTGYEAKTIHRLLEMNPKTGGFRKTEENPIECDLLVIDETSTVDVMLTHKAPAELVASDECHDQIVQPATFFPQSRAGGQHRIHQLACQLVVGDGFAHGLIKSPAQSSPQTDTERLQRVANAVLDIEVFALEIAPLRQEKPHPVARLGLDICLPEPAGAHDMRNAEGIRGVGLVALRRHRRADMLGLQAYHR